MFDIPESVRPLRDRVLAFIEKEIYPIEDLVGAAGPIQTDPLLADLKTKAKEQGIWVLGHPVHLGGGGLPFFDYVFVNEVIGRSSPAVAALGTATLQTTLMLDRHASEEMKELVLPGLVSGEFEVAFAITEPDVASSDPTQLQTTARLDGDEWVIDGHKWFISLVAHARYVIVMARTEDDNAPPHRRFSMILVPKHSPGFEILRELKIMGLTGMWDHWEIRFDDLRVPARNLIGERGHGFVMAQDRLGPGRIYHCMRWLGTAQRAFNLMCLRANERKLSGTPLADRQLIQQFVYDSYVDIHGARLMVLDAAARLDKGDQARVEVGSIKVECSGVVQRVVDRAIQVHGALGLCSDTPLEAMYRHIRAGRIVDGPDEAHVQRVGRYLLDAYKDGRQGWDFALR